MQLNTISTSLSSGDVYYIQDRPGRGKGCFATRAIAVFPTHILTAEAPLAHVVFRKYKKEVCAWCFKYDRGKTWPLSYACSHPISPKQEVKIAWFCSTTCNTGWRTYHDDIVCKSLAALEVFSRDYAPLPKIEDVLHEVRPLSKIVDTPGIDGHWQSAELIVQLLREARLSDKPEKRHRKILRVQALLMRREPNLDLDIVSYFLRGIISRYKSALEWGTIYSLVPSVIAYQTDPGGLQILESHCLAYRLLQLILPEELLSLCDQECLRTLTTRW